MFLKKPQFTAGAAVLTGTTFLSYVIGLLRDRILARTFGAGRELDLYNASFIVPDLLLNILIAGTLSAAFVPVFSHLHSQGAKQKANELANTILHAGVFAMLIACGLAAIFMPQLAKFVAPKFTPEEQQTLVTLSRFMLISPIFMTVSNTFGGMLVSFKQFLPYGLSPVFYNVGIIGGALFLVPSLGIFGLVIGTLIGAFLHTLPRFLSMKKSLFQYAQEMKLADKNFKNVLKLMVPKMIGHPVEQFTFLGFTRIATGLAAGSVAAVNFARNFQSVAVSLFGIAISMAVFPILAECAAGNDREKFLKNFWKSLRDILIFTIPAAIGLYILADLPIRIFLGGGKFSEENIVRTALTLSAFALSIPTESVIHLLARSFYALKNTIIPVTMGIMGLVISVSFAVWQAPLLGIVAIPYGFFLGSAVEVILLSIFLKFKLKNLTFTSPQS